MGIINVIFISCGPKGQSPYYRILVCWIREKVGIVWVGDLVLKYVCKGYPKDCGSYQWS
jgi:hypothetical protein